MLLLTYIYKLKGGEYDENRKRKDDTRRNVHTG